MLVYENNLKINCIHILIFIFKLNFIIINLKRLQFSVLKTYIRSQFKYIYILLEVIVCSFIECLEKTTYFKNLSSVQIL